MVLNFRVRKWVRQTDSKIVQRPAKINPECEGGTSPCTTNGCGAECTPTIKEKEIHSADDGNFIVPVVVVVRLCSLFPETKTLMN